MKLSKKQKTPKVFLIKLEGTELQVNTQGDKLHSLISDLGWEYQRMGRSGRQVYDEMCHLLNIIPDNEVFMDMG